MVLVTEEVHEDSDSVSDQTPTVTEEVHEETEVVSQEGTIPIPTKKLIRFPGNQRFDPKFGLETLLENIKRNGIKYPLVVCPADDGFYEVIDGERRRTCAVELGIKEVICRVEHFSEKEKWEMAYTLNDTIRPFSNMEKAMAAYERKKRFHLNNEELGKFLGVKGVQVGKLISLNKLPEELRLALHQGEIGVEAAYELSRLAFDVDFPNPGTSINEAIQNGIHWDFDWDQEPEDWAVRRTRLQLELLRDVADNRKSLGKLRGDIRDAIDTEKERREAIAKAEKEAAEKAEQERTEREKKHTALQTEIELKQKRRDEAITTYIEHCKNFENETGIELNPVGLKDPDDYKKVLDQGFMDFENLFGPKTAPVPMTWAATLKKLKAFDDTDIIEFRDERRCIHCGTEVGTETAQARQILIEALEGEIEAIKEQKKSIQAAREELFKKHQAIRSIHYALNHLQIELKNLEDQMQAEEGPETDHSGETDYPGSCPICEVKIVKEPQEDGWEEYGPIGVIINGEEVNRFVHSDCLDQLALTSECPSCNASNKDNNDVLLVEEGDAIKMYHADCYAVVKECPWCSKEINKDQIISELPVFVKGVETSLMIHDPCYDALLDAPCAACDDSISEDEPSVFILDEGTVMRYHANCALVNELIPDFSSASDMSSKKEEDDEDSFEVKSEVHDEA